MSLGVVLGFLFVLVGGIAFIAAGYFGVKKKKAGAVAGAVIGVIFAILLVTVPPSFHTVDAGEIAVVKHLGEARSVRTAGTHFDFWVTETYMIYDAKVQNMEIVAQTYSKDAQTMDISMTVQYQIDVSQALKIANQYGSIDILANRIQSIAVEKAKSTLSSYSAMNIIETRSTISPLVEDVIKNAVTEEYCVDIVAVVLTNIDFSDAFEQTVEDKMIAEQEKLKAEYEKETAIVNAQKELEVAKLAAQAKIESAKADAQAVIEAATAEARSIQLKSIEVARALGFVIVETEIKDGEGIVTGMEYTIDFTGKSAEEVKVITDYMQYLEYLAKWDGKLPSVMAGESATIMIPANPTQSDSAQSVPGQQG